MSIYFQHYIYYADLTKLKKEVIPTEEYAVFL